MKRVSNSIWVKFDAGKGFTPVEKGRDCQVRALSTALDIPYPDAWDMLYQMQGVRRTCGFPLVEELRAAHPALHVIAEMPFQAVSGKKRMTATEFCKKHPTGRFILRMPHHVAAVKDGVLYDTWDSSSKCVYTAWEIKP